MGERLLDDQNVLEVRAMLEANMQHLCDIQVNSTPNPNAGGATIATWISQALPFTPCQLSQEAQGSLQQRADQNRSYGMWRVRFAPGSVVTMANRLVVTGTNADRDFVKTLIPLAISETPTATMVHCREASPGEAR